MCVDLSNFSSSSSHGNTTRIGSKVLWLCGSTDQKLIFCLIRCPQLTENILPLTGHWTGTLLLRDVPFYLMAGNVMIEEMPASPRRNKQEKKWMKKDLKQFTPDVKMFV